MAKVISARFEDDLCFDITVDDDQDWYVNPMGDLYKNADYADWEEVEGMREIYDSAVDLLMDAVVDVNAKLSKRFGDEVPHDWDSCPKCGSKEIEGDSVEICDEQAMQKCSCRECGGKWLEVYEASHRVALDRETDEPSV